MVQGRAAGSNAVALLSGRELSAYSLPPPQVTFKYQDFELISLGILKGDRAEEVVLEGANRLTCRSVIVEDGVVVGLQMVGTREGYGKYAKLLKGRARFEDLGGSWGTDA